MSYRQCFLGVANTYYVCIFRFYFGLNILIIFIILNHNHITTNSSSLTEAVAMIYSYHLLFNNICSVIGCGKATLWVNSIVDDSSSSLSVWTLNYTIRILTYNWIHSFWSHFGFMIAIIFNLLLKNWALWSYGFSVLYLFLRHYALCINHIRKSILFIILLMDWWRQRFIST